MSTLQVVVPVLAAISSFVLMGAVVIRRPLTRSQLMFAIGMLGFTLEALTHYLLRTAEPARAMSWLHLMQAVGLVLPIPWVLFVIALGTQTSVAHAARWRLAVRVGAGVGLAALGGALAFADLIAAVTGAAPLAQLTPAGRYAVIFQILATVGVLGGLEACLRTSDRDARWHIKYLLLGLGGIFLVRFYFLSHALLFNVVESTHLLTEAATLFVGNLTIGVALLRDRLLSAEVVVSRHILYRSVIIAAAGSYLFMVGVLGWLLRWLSVPEALFWGSLVVFVSVLGLGAFLLSDDVRWWIKRFVERHFYQGKYDYRHQWMSFTKRLGSLLTLDELGPQFLAAVAEATGARNAALYLLDDRDGRYHLAQVLGPWQLTPAVSGESALLEAVRHRRAPAMLPSHGVRGAGESADLADVAVVVPVRWRGSLIGLILLGPERTGAPYAAEDLEFLATVSEQAAGMIMTTKLSENAARSREFEAFHRLTSFVIHDVKNAVAALSMLSRNALDNFDDPEFQRDAIRTLSKTVDRMRELLGRLSSAPDVARFRFVDLDVGALAARVATPLVDGQRLTLICDLQQVPRVLGDPDALGCVLQNLVVNAVEATDGEGQITLRTELRSGLVACSVSDTGCGIPADFMKQSLFVPFRTTKKNGWGVGLYQANEIVTAHRGRLEVESEEGKGTTFTMLLPPASGGTEVPAA